MPGQKKLTRTFPAIRIKTEVIMKNVLNKTVGTILVGAAIVLAVAFGVALPFNLFM